MKAMVIGGAGFIGSHLCDALLEEKNEVVCVDNFSLGTRENIAHLSGHERFTFYEADASNLEQLDNVFAREDIDYVFHMAANSDIQASAANPDIEYRNTYTTTYCALSCMRKYNVNRLFFASTSAVYGDKQDQILDENTPRLEPVSYYGAAKLGSEALISAFSYMNNIHSLVFRFPNVVGPRLTHGVIFDFMHKLMANPHSLQILGDGRQTKPYIYVSDLITAIMQLKNTVKHGMSLYNVGTDGSTSVTSIADIVCGEMQLKDVEYVYTGGESGWKGDVPRFSYCTDKIHRAGWKAKYTSDEAVRKTVRANIARQGQQTWT